ncbi:TrkH family potassium uptake protein [Robiginitomaculum antarcticum]|uniref:TrkH family potassium uptake protein n=1 Tax=Robiginitomaculum antarcticum TaxID=437507 RepID=UPI00037B5E44|nr:potassium transporter TrkG [Robiginitomaculum antarcticum]
MAITRLIFWLGNSFILCAFILAIAVFGAVVMAEFPIAVIFAGSAFFSALIGGILRLITQDTGSHETQVDALVFLLLFWVSTPLLLSIPFWLSGATGSGVQAYFEAVSAFTTTGATTLTPEDLPRSLIIYQCLVQFIGGVITATFAVAILAAINLGGTGVHISKLFTLQRGDIFSRLFKVGRTVGAVYLSISAICFLLMAMGGTSIFNAFCLSLTSISTGGITPQSGPLSSYVGRFATGVMAITCILGAANIGVLSDILKRTSPNNRSIRHFFSNIEHRGLIAIMILLIAFGLMFSGLGEAFNIIVESAFMVSSAGFDYEVIGIDMLPPAFLIMIALIGGSALSTAGGLKIIRLILLFSHAATDLDRMSHPSRVKLVQFKGQKLPDSLFLSIWMYFFGYTLVFVGGIVALAAAGITFEYAVALSAAGLSNIGPLLSATFPELSYSNLNGLQLSAMSVLMLIGRVEVLAALAAFSPSLWRK